jgi:pimeloyl-ACP methyl ester carboxylesterase
MSVRWSHVVLTACAFTSAVGVCAAGCGPQADAPPRRSDPSAIPSPREPDPEPLSPEALPPPPLPPARRITVETSDHVVLVGELRVGDTPAAPLVVLVHQLSSNRAEWEPLLRRLAASPAFTTFAIDMRGHGDSTHRAHGRDLDWQGFETRDWQRVATDLGEVLTALREREGLTPSAIALVGSSIGSSAVIVEAARNPAVNVVVALSPGRAYRGVDALTPAAALGDRAFLAVAAREELPSAETATDMGRVASRAEVLLVDGSAHGVAMFQSAPESVARVDTFLRERLAAAR